MLVYYNCPASGDNFISDNLFKKYRGKRAVIAGFPTEYVGPLDGQGRMPGTYYRPNGINVQFEGEDKVYYNLQLRHFVLLSEASAIPSGEVMIAQYAGELPNPIEFYPGDMVQITDGVQSPEDRQVLDVEISDGGEMTYVLSETKAEEDERVARVSRGVEVIFGSMPVYKRVRGDDLVLVRKGSVHRLYTNSSALHFDSDLEELVFWSQGGLSKNVYGDDIPIHYYPIDVAKRILDSGRGDFIVVENRPKRSEGKDSRRYRVRRIHGCFATFRDRIRDLSRRCAEKDAYPVAHIPNQAEIARAIRCEFD